MLKRFRKTAVVLNLIFLLTFVLPLCSNYAAAPTPSEQTAFMKAMKDTSAAATPQKVSNWLLAILPPPEYQGQWPEDYVNRVKLNGGTISWEGVPGKSRIRVAAFMDQWGYDNFYKSHILGCEPTSILEKSLWVTVVPELRNTFYLQAACPPTKNRIVKLLGLNPWNDYDVIVEMWVDSKDLFRPSPDPETTDHQAEIAVKAKDGSWVFPSPFVNYCTEKLYVSGRGKQPCSYKDWFKQNAIDSYQATQSKYLFPWTRLGYTYDWGNSVNHVGPSEFIIRLHPNGEGQTGGSATVTYIRAIKANDHSWNEYFRCRNRGDGINRNVVPDADINHCAKQ